MEIERNVLLTRITNNAIRSDVDYDMTTILGVTRLLRL